MRAKKKIIKIGRAFEGHRERKKKSDLATYTPYTFIGEQVSAGCGGVVGVGAMGRSLAAVYDERALPFRSGPTVVDVRRGAVAMTSGSAAQGGSGGDGRRS